LNVESKGFSFEVVIQASHSQLGIIVYEHNVTFEKSELDTAELPEVVVKRCSLEHGNLKLCVIGGKTCSYRVVKAPLYSFQ